MKTIILAGGLGTRFSEETENKPKPMILIDHRPILWHIMDIYASQGYSDFVIATGYKSEVIEEWIENLDTDWKVTAINTGLNTQTGGRIKRCIEQLDDKVFFATYGDGLGNVNLKRLIAFHESKKAKVTATAVRPPARFGYLEVKDGLVTKFGEKDQVSEGWINGGFFVLEREVLKYLDKDNNSFEGNALPNLAKENQLIAYFHQGFWKPMDSLKDKMDLNELWNSGKADWKIWK